jgi:hypothetical protein
MARVRVAHLQTQGVSFAVFDADALTHLDSDRGELLSDLTSRARRAGLRVEKSALAFAEHGRMSFYGTPDLVRYLAGGWSPHWTHVGRRMILSLSKSN